MSHNKETTISLNHGHDWVAVKSVVETDLEDGYVEVVFSGRDPTTVAIKLTRPDDIKALGQALLDAGAHIEARPS